MPLRDRKGGDTIVGLADGSLAELEPYISWNRRMNTPELLGRGFEMLGQLHARAAADELPVARQIMIDLRSWQAVLAPQ